MRINSIPPIELINKYIHVMEKTPVAKSNPAVDKAELTSEARTFSAAIKAAKETMEVRTPQELERINSVAQQVKNNTYSVQGNKVAEKILGR